MGDWVTLLRVATTIAQCGMILSPCPDIIKAHRNKTTGEVAALPLVSMVVNNYLWTDSIFPLLVTQVIGQMASIVFMVFYYRWAVDRRAVNRLLASGVAFSMLFTVYVVLGVTVNTHQTGDEVGTTLGYVGLVVNLWMYASPLGTIRHVIRTKSAASLPINISVMMLFSTSLWVALSIVDDDKIIMSLNITGVFLSVTQISVYIYYRPNKSIVASEAASVPMDKRISLVISPSNTTQAVKSSIYQSLASPSKRPVFEDRINDK
ncbi:Sugar efflux transporter for intercellular exchange [Phytophthora infestans]|uniref:Sugar transporter SWEET1 n=1 Tax=Phytophthora infestans TaxID=4787 RepID=A0A833WFW0_PHYIN|nr:Sugar efflux transporter for intercellular exchange [Phytophthora infestans]